MIVGQNTPKFAYLYDHGERDLSRTFELASRLGDHSGHCFLAGLVPHGTGFRFVFNLFSNMWCGISCLHSDISSSGAISLVSANERIATCNKWRNHIKVKVLRVGAEEQVTPSSQQQTLEINLWKSHFFKPRTCVLHFEMRVLLYLAPLLQYLLPQSHSFCVAGISILSEALNSPFCTQDMFWYFQVVRANTLKGNGFCALCEWVCCSTI